MLIANTFISPPQVFIEKMGELSNDNSNLLMLVINISMYVLVIQIMFTEVCTCFQNLQLHMLIVCTYYTDMFRDKFLCNNITIYGTFKEFQFRMPSGEER